MIKHGVIRSIIKRLEKLEAGFNELNKNHQESKLDVKKFFKTFDFCTSVIFKLIARVLLIYVVILLAKAIIVGLV